MNKKMRELLAKIEENRNAAKGFLEANETAKAQDCMTVNEDLEKQYEIAEKLFSAEQSKVPDGVVDEKKDTAEEADVKAFAGYVKAMVNKTSTPQNVTYTNNGAVIPTTIAAQIISKVKELCPIYANATIYNTKGTLKIPVWGSAADGDSNDHNITAAFAAEFTALTADAGKFTSVDLGGFLVGALTLIGKSVANNADVDVVSFIVNEMSRSIATFLEGKLINGESNYNQGAIATSTSMIAGSISAISGDNLIDLQSKIPTIYQGNAAWYMKPATFTAIKKLKDGNGVYLLQNDFGGEFPYRLLGKPVYLSDNMPAIGSANKAVLYGDMSGLAVNVRENLSIEVLTEMYATQHAIGVVGWMEFDSKVADNQKLATLVMSAT